MGFFDRFLKTPNWGVHPEDHKRPAADVPLRILPTPNRVYMPLSQHVGGAARPVVLVGQKVLKGQLVAEAQGNISDRKSTRLNSSHRLTSRMPSSA
jgi:electron transport complex protein RnfC